MDMESDLKDARVTRPMVKAVKRDMSEAEKIFLYGDDQSETVTDYSSEESVNTELNIDRFSDQKPTVTYSEPIRSIVPDGEVIVIKDQKKRVRIKYMHITPEGKEIVFSVGVPAASVEVQKDGVSILISKDIEIRPPALIPCILEVGTQEQPLKEYNVIFAGATHTIGKYINIPFIIVE